MSAIWVVGSLNVDLVVGVVRFPEPGETLHGTSFDTFLGGKGGNQAMAAALLGAAPRMVGRVGEDAAGARYCDALAAAGVHPGGVRRIAATPTGTALIEVDAEGRNRIVIVAGANASWEPGEVRAALTSLEPDDLVLLQLEIPFEAVREAVEEVARRGAAAVLDPAPASALPDEIVANLAWVTPNEHEAALITGVPTGDEKGLRAAARALVEAGAAHAVVKAGGRGACLATAANPEPRIIPAFEVAVVDTTAAGDAFNGGLAWALQAGCDPDEAVRRANAVAALSTTAMGAQTALPDAASVAALLGET